MFLVFGFEFRLEFGCDFEILTLGFVPPGIPWTYIPGISGYILNIAMFIVTFGSRLKVFRSVRFSFFQHPSFSNGAFVSLFSPVFFCSVHDHRVYT